MKKIIKIDGMSCHHCTARVEKALGACEGVTSVVVDLDSKTAIVELNADLTDVQLTEIIDDAGYDVVEIH